MLIRARYRGVRRLVRHLAGALFLHLGFHFRNVCVSLVGGRRRRLSLSCCSVI